MILWFVRVMPTYNCGYARVDTRTHHHVDREIKLRALARVRNACEAERFVQREIARVVSGDFN
jgi:hypothetical protein